MGLVDGMDLMDRGWSPVLCNPERNVDLGSSESTITLNLKLLSILNPVLPAILISIGSEKFTNFLGDWPRFSSTDYSIINLGDREYFLVGRSQEYFVGLI